MGERVNVLIVGNAPSVKGGITSVITQIMKNHWNDFGINMELIPTYEGGTFIHKMLFFARSYRKISKALKVHDYSIVHIHMSQGGSFRRKYLIHKLCRKYGIRDIIHLHSSSFMDFYSKANMREKRHIEQLLSESGCIIVLGTEWENRIRGIASKANTVIMNNTVSIPKIVSNQTVEPMSFLFLGVLFKRKGVIDLVKAINLLKTDGTLSRYPAIFNIGGTGECEEELKKYVIDNSISSYINFLGWVSGEEKIKQLEKNQVLVLPSYNEGLPIAILEAISYGMPVISTDVGSVSEAVFDGENGFLFKPGDIRALSDSIKKILESKELRESFGLKSRQIAEQYFNEEQYFNKLRELYLCELDNKTNV